MSWFITPQEEGLEERPASLVFWLLLQRACPPRGVSEFEEVGHADGLLRVLLLLERIVSKFISQFSVVSLVFCVVC